jgi:uncharacterized cupredoxin-like copper-binding protein
MPMMPMRTAAGFCSVLAIGLLAGAAAPGPVTLDVVMVDYKFIPDHLTFHHGLDYRLRLENRGKDTHEFTAPLFFAAASLQNPDSLNHEHSEAVVQPGEIKDVLLVAGKPGTYDLRCSDHDWAGMTGAITVD